MPANTASAAASHSLVIVVPPPIVFGSLQASLPLRGARGEGGLTPEAPGAGHRSDRTIIATRGGIGRRRALSHPSKRRTSMDIDTHNELETKAGIPLDAVVTHGDMMRAFEAFKETNDERLTKRDQDVVLEEKLARIDRSIDARARRLDEMTLKSARPAIGGNRADVRSA